MSTSLYLINPTSDFPGYYTSEVFVASGFQPVIGVADLAIATVAALAPADFQIRLCDEFAQAVDFGSDADFIGITGKVNQWECMKRIAGEFRRRGKTVLIGGPYASLSPEVVRPHCDILVRGEIEEVAAKLFNDLRARTWRPEYVGGKVSLAKSPIPRWDLYPNARALTATLQTSRGCPFECEFCDVIQYLGRKQRHKSIGQVLAELDELTRHGYRSVFLADDNFTVYRSRTKELLQALKEWNLAKQGGLFRFGTQVSIDAAGDEELLRMCAEAGLARVFIGIETPNEESLREAKKRQNLKRNLAEQIMLFVEHGIAVDAGMIVGFDADGDDIFRRQYEFAMSTAVPLFSLGALVAPDATPLHARLAKEGRLVNEPAEVIGTPWNTNIVPLKMSRKVLFDGAKWLANAIYDPTALENRIMQFLDGFGRRAETPLVTGDYRDSTEVRPAYVDAISVIAKIGQLGARESRMLATVLGRLQSKPAAMPQMMSTLVGYAQIRYMYDRGKLWDPSVLRRAAGYAEARRAAS